MSSEAHIQREIQLAFGRGAWRMFRNHVGMGWSGKLIDHRGDTVTLANARPLQAGLCVGSSDLIGWRSLVITPDMVGQTIAQFAAIEVKAAGGRATTEQKQFLHVVERMGGFGTIARSVDDVHCASILEAVPLVRSK